MRVSFYSKKSIFFFFICIFSFSLFANSKTIKIGWYIQAKYQEISDAGTPFGYNYDYLKAISEYTGWEYEFVYDSFDNCVSMLKRGEVDIVGCIIKTKERIPLFNYPEIPAGISYRYIFTNLDSSLTFQDLISKSDINIAVLSNSFNMDAYKIYATSNNLGNHNVIGCDNTFIMERMLNDGYVEAAITGTIPDTSKFKVIEEFSPQPFYFAISKKRDDLISDFNNAISAITSNRPDFTSNLLTKYDITYKNENLFTEKELEFIEKSSPINVAWSPLWSPLEKANSVTGEFSGYIREIFDEISRISGLKFNFVKCKNTEDSLAALIGNRVEIISLYVNNSFAAKQQGISVTPTIISLPIMVVKNTNNSQELNKVGIIHNKNTYNSLKGISNHELIRFSSIEDAFNALLNKEIDSVITNTYTAYYHLGNSKYKNLYGITLQETPINLSIALSENLPKEIFSIFEKTIQSIPTSTINDILIKTTITNKEAAKNPLLEFIDSISNYVILLLFGLLVIILIIISVILTRKNLASQTLQTRLFTDSLTGLLSKEGFDWFISKKIEKTDCSSYCIISFDMDHFEHYNILFGYKAGDELLKNIGRITTKYCPRDELCAHLNSDHFVLFANEKDISAERRIDSIRSDIQTLQENYRIYINFGIYRFSNGILSPTQMRDYAYAALRTVKNDSTKYIGYYDQKLHQKLIGESVIASKMEEALKKGEFIPYFQPKYGCSSELPVGAEALVRWKKYDGTIIPPNEFIPLFEKNGFILKLDMHIFEETCKVIAEQINHGLTPVPISTNFSRAHMYNQNFAKQLAEIVGKYNIPPHLLEIEITESAFSSNQQLLHNLIESLHGYGFLVSVDDFGSGYSSLNLIKEIRFDIIKIDQVFFRYTGSSARTKSVVQCIIALAKELGMRTVAEGVETEEQFRFLKENQCDTIQGFYFSKPLEKAIFTELLASNDSADI